MSKGITESLARIGEQSARLNQLCDEGAATIRELEDVLEKMNVGVPASVKLVDEDDGCGYWEIESFVYSRIGSRFRIGHYRADASGPDSVVEKPWSDCSRQIKIDTLHRLPDLVAAIADEVEKRAKLAETAIATVKKLTVPSKKKEG